MEGMQSVLGYKGEILPYISNALVSVDSDTYVMYDTHKSVLSARICPGSDFLRECSFLPLAGYNISHPDFVNKVAQICTFSPGVPRFRYLVRNVSCH